MYNKIQSVPAASVVVLVILLLLMPFSFAESESSADSDAIPTMARIVAEMNHFPSAKQKETLMAISQDENNSEATQAIADAIRNMEHKPKPEDVAALKEVVAEDSSVGKAASEAEKRLAAIVMDFNHKASAEAKQKLETLAE